MLVLAYQMMAESPAERLKPVLDLFTETALEIGDGQQLDMEFEKRTDVTEDEYIEMIRLKTSVLLACALKIGAILAGASEEDADNLYRFGEKIGLAFQLQDDYLDVYGDEKVFARPSAATSPPTRRPTCSSTPSSVPMRRSARNWSAGWR